MATAQDVIDRVRDYYGERIPTQLSDSRLFRALNDGLKRLYSEAPLDRLRYYHTGTGALSLGTYGSVVIPANVLRLVNVRNTVDSTILMRVPAEAIKAIDSSSYMTPKHPVFAVSDNRLYVRPLGQSVEIQYVPIPSALTTPAATVPVGEDLVLALGYLVAGLCFLQEEAPDVAAAMFEAYKAALGLTEGVAQ